MHLYELYRDLYYNEMQERRFYDDKIGFTFTILSAMATALSFLITKYQIASCIIKHLICMSVGLFAVQIVLVFKTYFSWKYKYYDFPVDRIEESIKKHYKSNCSKIEGRKLDSNDWIYGMLCRTYATCSRLYYKENLKKRRAHHVLNLISYFNLVILMLTFIALQM